MGLSPDLAEYISFVELLDVPTTGRTDHSTFWKLFNEEHARRLDDLFQSDGRRLILVSDLVIRLMHAARRSSNVFGWLPANPAWGPICHLGDAIVYKARHFSAAISTDYLRTLGDVVRSACVRHSAPPPRPIERIPP